MSLVRAFPQRGFVSLEDEPRSGRPTEIDLSELKDVIESDPALTWRDVAKLGQWVPHNRVDYSQLLFSLHRTHDWLRNLITGDEKWCLYVNVKGRRQWLKRGQAPKPTGLHPQKMMLCIWWGVKGVMYWELLQEKQQQTLQGTVLKSTNRRPSQ